MLSRVEAEVLGGNCSAAVMFEDAAAAGEVLQVLGAAPGVEEACVFTADGRVLARAGRMAGGNLSVACPRCGSNATERISQFGSTPCKAAWRCRDCLEPFDYFKCH